MFTEFYHFFTATGGGSRHAETLRPRTTGPQGQRAADGGWGLLHGLRELPRMGGEGENVHSKRASGKREYRPTADRPIGSATGRAGSRMLPEPAGKMTAPREGCLPNFTIFYRDRGFGGCRRFKNEGRTWTAPEDARPTGGAHGVTRPTGKRSKDAPATRRQDAYATWRWVRPAICVRQGSVPRWGCCWWFP
jgi:hypothetical protein